MPLQLLPKIAKCHASCSVRIVVLEFGLGRLTARDHPEVDRLPHRAKRTDPSSGSGRRPAPAGLDQRAAPSAPGPAPWGSASVPARESPARVLPVGPGRRFSARDPASPGVACSTLVPRRARLANAQRADARHPSQCPEAHGPSVPRARLDASCWRWAACLPSQAERPAFQPAGPGPQPSESQRARGGHPTPSDAGLRPTLSEATAPQRPPG